MHAIRLATCWMAMSVAGGVAPAQNDHRTSATAALQQGPLTVWIVPQTSPRTVPVPVVLDKSVREQTAGSFGQTSGSYGTAASDHGQTAGSLGQDASNTGQNASSYGQPAGSFGRQASAYGTAASDHGQTAGSFGHSLSTIADAGSLDTQAAQGSTRLGARAEPPVRNSLGSSLQTDLRQSFSDLAASFTVVSAAQLEDELGESEGKAEYPDVILGQPLPPEWWRHIAANAGIVMLGSKGMIEQESNASALLSANLVTQAAILERAPHPEAARAFVVWMCERGIERLPASLMKIEAEAPAPVAVAAVNDLLGGRKVSAADPAMAEFSAVAASAGALAAPSTAILEDLGFRIDVLSAAANERFAVVALRVVASSEKVFGVVHPLVVLRKAEDGRWKVLQISSNLMFDLQIRAFNWLYPYTRRVKPEYLRPIAGISQAAPLDEDNRSPRPDLWWDNGGGGSLLIVEWQRRAGAGWTDSNMFFIPDNAPRLQTRVTAQFADSWGAYHWRVWTLGRGGMMTMSPWRTMNINSR